MVRTGDSSFRAAIAVGEFRSIWLAELQSVIGDQLARLAVSVLVFQDTGSATWPALFYALTYLPDLVAGPLLGGLADRFPRRTIMIGADALRAVAVGAMALPGIPVPVVAALLVTAQLAGSPFSWAVTSRPAARSARPRLRCCQPCCLASSTRAASRSGRSPTRPGSWPASPRVGW